MPRSLGQVRGVDEVDGLLGVAREDPGEHGDAEQAGVLLGEAAAELDLDPADGAVAEALGEASRASRQSGTNGASASITSGRTAAMLTAVVTTPPVSAAVTCSAVTTPARSWASAVEAPRCGRDDDVVALQDRVVGEGLLGEDVERGAGDPARLEPLGQRVEVDQLAAGAVDDPDALAHLRRSPRRRSCRSSRASSAGAG